MAKNYQVGLIIKGNAKGGVSAVKATKDEIAQLNNKQKRFQKEAQTSRTSISGMTKDFGLLKGVVAGVSFGVLASEVYKGIDAFQGYQGQLKTITGDHASASKELGRLIEISRETPFTLAQSVEGFTKLTHLGLDPSRASMISYGNTAAAMGKDLMQMVEAVADASVGEFERLKDFGIKASSQGDKVRFTFQGNSTTIKKDAASIQQYLIDLGNNKFGNAMADQMERLSAKTSNLQTSLAQLYDAFGSAGASGSVGGGIDAISLGVDGLRENLPAVISVIETLSVVAGGHLVAALARSGKGMLDNKIAAMAKLQANVQLQASEILLAKTANQKAIQEQLAAKRALSLASTSYARSRAITNLAVANGKATASEIALTAATNAHSVAMKRANVTARLLGGSVALLGGPVGVAMLAGYALYEMSDGMDTAKVAADNLRASTDLVTSSIATMTKRQQELKAANYKRKIDKKTAEIMALGKQAQQLESMDARGNNKRSSAISAQKREDARVLSAELSVLQEAYGKLQEKLVGVNLEGIKWNKVIVDGKDVTGEATQDIIALSDASQSLIDRLDPLSAKSSQFGADMQQLHSSYLTGALNLAEYEKHIASLVAEFKESTAVKDKELSSDQKFIASLKEKVRLGGMSEAQKQAEINLSKLSIKATDDQREEVDKYTAALIKQQKVADQQSADSDYYQSIIDGANEIGESWNTAGNVIVNTFGTIGEQLDKLAKQQENYANKQRKLAIDKDKYAADPKKLSEIGKAENALAKQKDRNAMSEISSYRAITDSAASMFSENSKGRKAMQAASDVFTAVELANSVLRIGSYAVEAVAAAFAAPWPIGFASGAAMIAIMAGLGVAVSGGSGTAPMSAAERQETQGTGTVLGSDDKSTSLQNSLDRSEDLQLDQYVVLTEMLSSMNDLNSNITHLATSLVRNFGKFNADSYGGQLGKTSKYNSNGYFEKIGSEVLSVVDPLLSSTGFGDPLGGLVDSLVGSFNTTKKSLVDSGISIVSQTMSSIIDNGLVDAQAYFDIKTKKKSFWGLSSKTSYDTEYQDINQQLQHEMALVFGNISDTVNSAVDVLGLDVTENLKNFVIDLPNISFKDLSGDEIQAELQAVFSEISDDMATYLVPGLQDFQKVGEGLYETLIRLAQEQAVFNSILEITGNTLNSIDANQTIAATQAIIDFAGGIENLQSAASDFFNGFYSDTEQFEYNQKQLLAQFSALGQELPATAAGFKKLVQGLDPLNEADQRLYAQLLLLSGQTSEYYDALEDQQTAIEDAIEAEKELALERMNAIASLKTDIQQLVDDLVNPSINYQSLIKEEETRWKNQQDAAEELYKTEMSRYESALSAEQTLDEYINGLAFSENSTLSDWQQQSLARSQFNDAVTRAGGGDFGAVSDATGSASQLLDIVKERYGGDSESYRDMFTYVNSSLSDLQGFYADFEAPDQQIIAESPELISLREQLAESQAAAQQAENQALADLLTSQLSDLSALSGDSIDSLIESFSIDLGQLGELLSVNLLELIDVTKQGVGTVSGESLRIAGNIVAPINNVVPINPQSIAPWQQQDNPTQNTTVSNGDYAEVVAELKLLREEVAAFRADSNDNADGSAELLNTQIKTLEVQTDEIVRSNLRQVSVS